MLGEPVHIIDRLSPLFSIHMQKALVEILARRMSLFLLGLLLPSLCLAATPQVPARPESPVVDLAEVLDLQLEQQLAAVLDELQEQTGDQFVILTIHSLDGEDVAVFSRGVAKQWLLGQAGKNNGLLLTAALQEGQYHFEKGNGLDKALPAERLALVGSETLDPLIKKGKVGAGLAAAASEIIEVLQQHHGVSLAGSDKLAQNARKAGKQFPWQVIFILLMIYVVLRSRGRKG